MNKSGYKKSVILIMIIMSIAPLSMLTAGPVKIMPLGDSITGTPGCWRAYLWNRLLDSGYTDIDFVGTLAGQTCSLPFDADSEGHGGILATDIAAGNQLPPWLTVTNPDIILMHLGTNDILSRTKTTQSIIASFDTMVDQMRAHNPRMKILVAQIIPMYSATTQCTVCYQEVIDLNAAIPVWAASKTTSLSPVIVVDQWTGFDTSTDTGEGIHPNDTGNRKIADKWYPYLADCLNGILPTTSPAPDPTNVPNVPGDVNNNGKIDIIDALMIAQYCVGSGPAGFLNARADVNCSGSIEILDALIVAQYSVGLIPQWPC